MAVLCDDQVAPDPDIDACHPSGTMRLSGRTGRRSLAEFGDLPVFLDDVETTERLFKFGVTFSSSAVTAASQSGSGTLTAAVR